MKKNQYKGMRIGSLKVPISRDGLSRGWIGGRIAAVFLALVFALTVLFGARPAVNAQDVLAITSAPVAMKVGTKRYLKANRENVTWRSANTGVLEVAADGRAKAIKPGKAKVIVIHGEEKAVAYIKVRKHFVVGIDPGHQSVVDLDVEPIGPGSTTTKTKMSSGTRGVSTQKPEHVLNLEISLALEKELQKRGYKVVMTRRTADVKLSNIDRAMMLNKNCDAVLRIHADGATAQARGASALYPSATNPYVGYLSAESARLSRDVLDCYCAATGLTNRGLIPRDDLTGTNWSVAPVTLIEMGFMTNPIDDEYMSMELGQKKMVQGLANGIDLYFNDNAK